MTSLAAHASRTVDFLSSHPRIAVPVYQREYRWRQEVCHQLLADIRHIATAAEGESHFLGPILAAHGDEGVLTLVDGQQRVTTLLLLLAAVRSHASNTDPVLAGDIDAIVRNPAGRGRLIPHERFHSVVEGLLSGTSDGGGDTTFHTNYAYFVDEVADDWRDVWDGVQRLEHVTAFLGPQANAQQVFESLNSTGASLSGDELIHNYIHMGRRHAEQLGLERDVWLPIEQATAGATEEFWRDYLLLTSDRQPDFSGDFGIYRSFRARFPSIRADLTPGGQLAASWLTYADLYGSILRPQSNPHPEVARQLRLLQAFGGAPRPLVLGLLSRHQAGQVGTGHLLQLLEMVQTMFIRRAVVDLPRDFGIVGTLCREMMSGADLGDALTRRTPEDKPVRLRLSYQRPPQVAYVLSRLQNATDISDLHVEHIYPQTPTDRWAMAPDRTWGGLTNDEQSEYRMLLDTLGNLTLLEGPLNIAASNRSPGDKATYYAQSHVAETKTLLEEGAWDLDRIKRRTTHLTERFLETWPRRSDKPMDPEEDLVRFVDLRFPAQSMRDPERFEFARFRGELWGDVPNVRALQWRVANALCQMDMDRLRAAENGGHITPEKGRYKRHAPKPLPGGMFLYQGWATHWLADNIRIWVEEFGLQDELHVKLIDPEELLGAAP